MIKRTFILLVAGFFMLGCKSSIQVANESQTKTLQPIELGSIGEDKQFVLENDYNPTALPVLSKPIRLKLSLEKFNKSSYKAFAKANTYSAHPVALRYDDSMAQALKFLKLELADRVTVLNALNDNKNSAVKDYISNKKEAHMVSAISLVFDEEKTKTIRNADAVFLKQQADKTFTILAYKNNEELARFKFSDAVVFAYQASSFCWQENNTRQLNIVDIVEGTDKCPNGTYRSAKRAKKKINYYKF